MQAAKVDSGLPIVEMVRSTSTTVDPNMIESKDLLISTSQKPAETPAVPEQQDIKPQLLSNKFQRLKNSATKLARVLIIDENPQIAAKEEGGDKMGEIVTDKPAVSQEKPKG